jgi:hypothetical protein
MKAQEFNGAPCPSSRQADWAGVRTQRSASCALYFSVEGRAPSVRRNMVQKENVARFHWSTSPIEMCGGIDHATPTAINSTRWFRHAKQAVTWQGHRGSARARAEVRCVCDHAEVTGACHCHCMGIDRRRICTDLTPSETSWFSVGVNVLFPFLYPKSLYPRSSEITRKTCGSGLAATATPITNASTNPILTLENESAAQHSARSQQRPSTCRLQVVPMHSYRLKQ